MPDTVAFERVSLAIAELAKGMKVVAFYPPGHPALIQGLSRIVSLFEAVPLPEAGLEIEVSRDALLYSGTPIAPQNKAVADLNHALYLHRASKLIFLPEMKPDETTRFLEALARDPQEVQDLGGLEKVLLKRKVSRIWVNRVDYEGLTEMLKKEDEPPTPSGEEELPLKSSEVVEDLFPAAGEEQSIEAILDRIEKETDPSSYRDHLVAFTRALGAERSDRRIEHAARGLSIFAAHLSHPPRASEEIAKLAQLGIREVASEEMVGHFIGRLRNRSGRGRGDAETILVAVGERAVKPLIAALAEEEDIVVRKAIIDVVIRIGRPAAPAIVESLNDPRWYIVRNMVTILGALGLPDLAPQVASVLAHPDLRVKKEAIKALARMPHPAAVQSLGELCFSPEETVALTATAALAAKKEPESVLVLYRRAVQRRFLFPHFRLAHEAIDSLRAIGTEEALQALEDILAAGALFKTRKFRELKIHALRSISRIERERAHAVLEQVAAGRDKHLRWEAKRLLKRLKGEQEG